MHASMEPVPSQSRSPQHQPHRWKWVLALCTVAILICYADRSNVSVAILEMAKQYEWDESHKGTVLSVFFIGYAGTQLLGGTLADRYGGKKVLTVGLVTWSLFTFVTPEAAMLGSATLISCRIAMGLGEVRRPSRVPDARCDAWSVAVSACTQLAARRSKLYLRSTICGDVFGSQPPQ